MPSSGAGIILSCYHDKASLTESRSQCACRSCACRNASLDCLGGVDGFDQDKAESKRDE